MVRAGLPVRFLNPDERSVGTLLPRLLWNLKNAGMLREDEANHAEWGTAGVGVDPLGLCELTGNGFVTPTEKRIVQAGKQARREGTAYMAEWLQTETERREAAARERARWGRQQAALARRARELEQRERDEVHARVGELKAQGEALNPKAAARWRTLREAMRRRG